MADQYFCCSRRSFFPAAKLWRIFWFYSLIGSIKNKFSSLFQNCDKLKCKPTHTYRNANKTEYQHNSPIQEAYQRFHSLLLQRIKSSSKEKKKKRQKTQKRCRMRIAILTASAKNYFICIQIMWNKFCIASNNKKPPRFLSRSLTLLSRSLKVKSSFEWEHTRFGKSGEGLFVCWPKQVPECNLFQLKTC